MPPKTLPSHPKRDFQGLHGSVCRGWRNTDMEQARGVVQKGSVPTILTSPETIGVVVADERK